MRTDTWRMFGVSFMALFFMYAQNALAAVPLSTQTLAWRSSLIESYVQSLIACRGAQVAPCVAATTTTALTMSVPVAYTNTQSLPPAQLQVALQAQAMGNDLFAHLQTLFVLDALFRAHSDGFLSPGGTSLGDIIVLYQLFFARTQ